MQINIKVILSDLLYSMISNVSVLVGVDDSSPYPQDPWAHWLKGHKSHAMATSHWCDMGPKISAQLNTYELMWWTPCSTIIKKSSLQYYSRPGCGQIINAVASPLDKYSRFITVLHSPILWMLFHFWYKSIFPLIYSTWKREHKRRLAFSF